MSTSVCASCLSFSIDKIVKSQPTMKPTWLDKIDYVEEFIEKVTDFKIRKQKNYDTFLDLEIKNCSNKKILYWGAESKPFYDVFTKDAKTAYGDFKNYGIAKCDDKGKFRVYFKFPQVYSTIQKGKRTPQTYHPHLHFVISNHDETKWLSQIYTKIVVKNLNYVDMERRRSYNNMYFLLNTLPCEYYSQDHIPNSFNLHYKQIKKMSVEELHNWFKNVIKRHYLDIDKVIDNGKLKIYEIPIICYCAHKDCNASELALEELAKKGFVNVSLYEGGMLEYNKKKGLN